MKICPRCHQNLPLTDFARSRARRDGLDTYCRPCKRAKQLAGDYSRKWYLANRTRHLERCRSWAKNNPERILAKRVRRAQWTAEYQLEWNLRTKYGLTLDQHAALLDRQSDRCAICRSDDELVVDHDHVTGRVRALLCDRCNVMIYRDRSPSFYRKIAEYLEQRGRDRPT